MFKFLVKVVIVVLALQSGMGYLKKEDIIVGEIRINYPVLKEKLLKLVPTKKIADKLLDVVNTKISQAIATKREAESNRIPGQTYESPNKNRESRTFVHVVANGETLNEVSNIYGIPGAVIVKINGIQNSSKLTVGQRLRIPSLVKNLS